MIEPTRQLLDFLQTPPPKNSFEDILRKLSSENENLDAAVLDLLKSLSLQELIETIKQWRKI